MRKTILMKTKAHFSAAENAKRRTFVFRARIPKQGGQQRCAKCIWCAPSSGTIGIPLQAARQQKCAKYINFYTRSSGTSDIPLQATDEQNICRFRGFTRFGGSLVLMNSSNKECTRQQKCADYLYLVATTVPKITNKVTVAKAVWC